MKIKRTSFKICLILGIFLSLVFCPRNDSAPLKIKDTLGKGIPRILKRQAEAVAKSLTQHPWTGKILAVDNNTIKISAGKDLGVYTGQLLTVFAKGESVQSRTGKSIGLLGKKIGKIKVTSVMQKQSLAEPVANSVFLPGQIIRFRP